MSNMKSLICDSMVLSLGVHATLFRLGKYTMTALKCTREERFFGSFQGIPILVGPKIPVEKEVIRVASFLMTNLVTKVPFSK